MTQDRDGVKQAGSVSAGPAAPTLAASPTPSPLLRLVRRAIESSGGWLPFDRFMAMALYAPGLGYYSRSNRQFGAMPSSGSDFVTAPEMSPLFGAALARQLTQALDATGTDELWEFGAGSGALASRLLPALGERLRRYSIVDLSGALRARQRETLAAFGKRVRWLDALPDAMRGVVVGNELLDAMPVQLLRRGVGDEQAAWFERGVAIDGDGLRFVDRASALCPPVAAAFAPGSVTEIHPQAEAFVRTRAERLEVGAAFLIDYGFPEAEYYLPERIGGTLMCHRAHQADTDPLQEVGDKDITAHVDFSAIALTAQDAGFEVLGYTSQARFLLNCGLAPMMAAAQQRSDWPALVAAQKLIAEHEMGELFKVIGLVRGVPAFDAIGFAVGDRSHRL
ncbi:MAG: SAM-dependent methyltransferase [Burkholderiaceae bacterium]